MQFSQKQNEYIRESGARWNFKVGAVRSGKSFVDVAYVIPAHLRALRNEKGLNVFLGVSKETIERNVLQPMREIYTDAIVGTINSRNIAMVCGVPVYCLGAEKVSQVSKLQGASIKYCYGDEIAKWNKEVFAILESRLDKDYSVFDGACNPEYPGHWLKNFIDREDLDMYLQKYTIFDNPFLSQSFVDNLCKEYQGTVYYNRYILGEWTLAEGLIYPMYADAIAEPPQGQPSKYVLSIDYGTQNPFAAILWGLFGDVWYAVKEYYYSGRDTGQQKTDEDYGNDMDKFTAGIDRVKTIIDPSAASFIALLRRKHRYNVIPADNAVADGIRETAMCLKNGIIKISPRCKNWQTEAQGYVWDENTAQDTPVKESDHCVTGDTLVMTESGEKPIADLVGSSGQVWSYNTNTNQPELKPFHSCRKTRTNAAIYKITLEDGRVIRCTGDHPILTENGYKNAMYLKPSDKVVDIRVKTIAVKSVEFDGYSDVYNMEVEGNHNFVVNNGIVVHNCMDSMRYFVKTMNLGRPRTNYTSIYEQKYGY